jgi:hypothetical protein
LAILGTIAFISLQWYSAEARDSKRVADVRALISKVTIENSRNSTPFASFLTWSTSVTVRTVEGLSIDNTTSGTWTQWVINFTVLKESDANFKDPGKGKSDYVYAVTRWGSWTGSYDFFQFGTVNEVGNKAVLLWNVFQFDSSDYNSIIGKKAASTTETSISIASDENRIDNGEALTPTNVLYDYK